MYNKLQIILQVPVTLLLFCVNFNTFLTVGDTENEEEKIFKESAV